MGVLWVGVAALFVAGCLVIWRMVRGPTSLDRIIAADVLVAIAVAAVAVYTIVSGNRTGLPILLSLSLVGFTAAVAVARLLASNTSVRRAFDRRRAYETEDSDDS